VAEGWLWLNGEEVFNDARAQAYVARGLAGPYLTAGEACCDALSVGIAGDQQTYVAPDVDPAPWYDPGDPASAEFLGFLVQISGLDATLNRSVLPRTTGRGGGKLSRLHPKERNVVVQGHTVAASQAGQEYGIRWLISRLSTNLACDNCSLDEALFQAACPSEGMTPESQRWALRDVGVLSGPTHTLKGEPGANCAEIRPFDLTLVSEHPYLYQDMETVTPLQTFGLPPSGCMDFCDWWGTVYTVSGLLHKPTTPDDVVARVIVQAGDRPATFEITATDGAGCPPSGGPARVSIPVYKLPAGSTLVIDSSTETVELTMPDGTSADGFPYLALDETTPFGWMSLGCEGADTCVAVSARPCGINLNTKVQIDAVRRRL
jgi:hypothetical protein